MARFSCDSFWIEHVTWNRRTGQATFGLGAGFGRRGRRDRAAVARDQGVDGRRDEQGEHRADRHAGGDHEPEVEPAARAGALGQEQREGRELKMQEPAVHAGGEETTLLPAPSGRYLAEEHALSVTPSISVLHSLRGRGPQRYRAELLGVADPVVNRADPRGAGAAACPQPQTCFSLPRLVSSGAEVAACARLLGPGQATLLEGLRASEAELRRAARTPHRYWHFSSHVVVDGERPNNSFVALSLPERLTVFDILGLTPRIHLIDPVPYETLVHLMIRSYLILTDSGGIQEECYIFRKPVIVLREVTERSEAIGAGYAFLAGHSQEKIRKLFYQIDKRISYGYNFFSNKNPFGDGKAAGRIAKIIEKKLLV